MALLFTFEKNVHLQYNSTRLGSWKRLVGNEIFGKTIGIIGLGAIGKELAKKCNALGVKVLAFDIYKDELFIKKNPYVDFVDSLDNIYEKADILSLHIPHTPQTELMINEEVIFKRLKKTPVLINTSRGMLVDSEAILKGDEEGKLRGSLKDVLRQAPMSSDEVLRNKENVVITPHVGSSTVHSVERQGVMAVENLMALIADTLT